MLLINGHPCAAISAPARQTAKYQDHLAEYGVVEFAEALETQPQAGQ
jgi:hypothetical protein